MKLKFIRIDVPNNTIEATWFESVLDQAGQTVSEVSAKCVNYSPEQKAEFLAEVEGGQAYADAIGW